MDILAALFAGATELLLVTVVAAVPYLIYTRSTDAGCRGCALSGCIAPVLGFIMICVGIFLSGDVPDFGGILLLPFFAVFGAVLGLVAGDFIKFLRKDK